MENQFKKSATIHFDRIVCDWVVRIHIPTKNDIDVYGGFGNEYSAMTYCVAQGYEIDQKRFDNVLKKYTATV